MTDQTTSTYRVTRIFAPVDVEQMGLTSEYDREQSGQTFARLLEAELERLFPDADVSVPYVRNAGGIEIITDAREWDDDQAVIEDVTAVVEDAFERVQLGRLGDWAIEHDPTHCGGNAYTEDNA